MSDYSSLKATINANVKANNNQEITGAIMNSVLNAMVNSLGAGYQFIGVATPTNPGSAQTPDYKCFYLATTPGTYTYLGGLVVADGEVALLKYDTSWTKEVTGIASADKLNQLGQEVIYDVTMNNPTAGPNNDGKFESLPALLSDANLSTLIPVAVRCGGMSIRFVLTSDNKYVQYRLMTTAWSTSIYDWQGVNTNALITVDDELVTKEGLYLDRSYSIEYFSANYRINANGDFGSNSSNKHICLLVNTGEKYHIRGIADYVLRVAFATTIESAASSPVPVVSGTSVVEIPANTSILVTIPEGCTTLLLWRNDVDTGFIVKKVRDIDEEPTLRSKNLIDSNGVAETCGYRIKSNEWIRVIVDKNNKILFGIKTDGSIEWGIGVPLPVRQLVESETSRFNEYVEDPIYSYAIIDSDRKVVFGIKKNGEIESETSRFNEYVEDPIYSYAIIDSDRKVVFGIKKNGEIDSINSDDGIIDGAKNTNANTTLDNDTVELPAISSNVEVRFTTGSSIYKQQETKTLFKVGDLITINVNPVVTDETMESQDAYFCDKCWADVDVTVKGVTQTVLMRLQNFGHDIFSIRLKYPDLTVNLDGTTEVVSYLPSELEGLYIKKTSTIISIHYADDSVYRSWTLSDYDSVDSFVEALKADSTFTDVFEIVKYTCEDVTFDNIENFDKVHLCREMNEIKYRQGDGTPTYTGKTYWDAYPMFFRTSDVGYEHKMKLNYRVINGNIDKVYFSIDGLYLIFNNVNGSTSSMVFEKGTNSIVNYIKRVSILPYTPIVLPLIAKQHNIAVSETLLENAGNTTSTMHEFSILSFFRKKGFCFQNFDECISTIKGCNAINNSAVCIMFDDMQIGNWTNDTIRNMLHEFRVRPTLSYLFDATKLDDVNPPSNAPTAEQYKAMKESHWDLQSHGFCMYMQQLTYAQFKQGFEKCKAAWLRWYNEDVCSYNGHGSHLTQWQYYLLKHMGFHTITGSSPHIGWYCEAGTSIDIQYKRISWINGDTSQMAWIINYINALCD